MTSMWDPLTFFRAEDYFHNFENWGGPRRVVAVTQDAPPDVKYKESWHGINITFDDETVAVVQFIRPTLWRVRYDPAKKDGKLYSDVNTRTITMDYMSELTYILDKYHGLKWTAGLDLSEDETYWTFESHVTESHPTVKGRTKQYAINDGLKLVIHTDPFRIQAIRTLTPLKELYPMPQVYSENADSKKDKVVWQTSPRTFRTKINETHDILKDIILDIVKAGHGEYVGFGEQGGTAFMKKACYMNFFNADNMGYQQVYNKGPLDPREPLYHSDPFYLDVNSNPEHANVTATFVDNYSQIAVDFGKTNAGYVKLGVRFGGMDCYFMSADTVPKAVALYTALIGRPKLKPRYVLGNHQACYGYENDADINAVWKQYRANQFPLDGIHIDVDFQYRFRTFTIDPKFNRYVWKNPKAMFDELRADGIKCSTNITPVISGHDITDYQDVYPDGYTTLKTALQEGHLVTDERYKVGGVTNPLDVRYMCYGGGNRYEINPNSWDRRPDYGDAYDFAKVWDSGKPYHGAVSYGYHGGTFGHYPNLNNKESRIWWGQQYKYLFEQGLEFVWQDMTTPAIGEAYGDMKGFPSRLLVDSDHGGYSKAVPGTITKIPAIQQWALYSYNLHKATANGLNHLHELVPSRKGKRNFILGRGSYAGMYRYAGLWTGDNASTWDFWKITVSQVLSVGLNGVSIAGADCGGFEPSHDQWGNEEKWCSPELLIRWYSGSVLLPWLRNHYVRKQAPGADPGTRRKYFQEPYAYPIHAQDQHYQGEQFQLYQAAFDIPKYFVQLRYSLMQVLYDAMFDNMFTGLPIAQSMLLTDTQDFTFFNESQEFLDNQYVVGGGILIAPVMDSREQIRNASKDYNANANRDVYLPLGYNWYQFNLGPSEEENRDLWEPCQGGSVRNYDAEIPLNNKGRIPYVCPMFIREGSIIPQLNVTPYVGDISNGPNHMRFNVYPGVDTSYKTYLDDGVSRDSAPNDLAHSYTGSSVNQVVLSKLTPAQIEEEDVGSKYLDTEALGKYRCVTIAQTTDPKTKARTVSIIRPKRENPLHDYCPNKELGTSYSIVFWYPPGTSGLKTYSVKSDAKIVTEVDETKRTIKVTVQEILGEFAGPKGHLVKVTPPEAEWEEC